MDFRPDKRSIDPNSISSRPLDLLPKITAHIFLDQLSERLDHLAVLAIGFCSWHIAIAEFKLRPKTILDEFGWIA